MGNRNNRGRTLHVINTIKSDTWVCVSGFLLLLNYSINLAANLLLSLVVFWGEFACSLSYNYPVPPLGIPKEFYYDPDIVSEYSMCLLVHYCVAFIFRWTMIVLIRFHFVLYITFITQVISQWVLLKPGSNQ